MTAAQAPRLSHKGSGVVDSEATVKGNFCAPDYLRAECDEIAAGVETIMELSDVNVTSQCIRRSDRTAIELLKLHTPTAAHPRARRALKKFVTTHVSFHVDNLESAAESAHLHGRAVHRQTPTQRSGPRLLLVSDADGLSVELVQTIPTSVS